MFFRILNLLSFAACLASCRNSVANKKDIKSDTIVAPKIIADESIRDTVYERISLINLIATPEKYHNKWVSVHGYLVFEFEGHAIYLSELDYKHGLGKNSIWVNMEDSIINKPFIDAHSYKYAILRGQFDKDDTGHMGYCSGGLKNITRLILFDSALP